MIVTSRARFALDALPPDAEALPHVQEIAAAAARAAALVRQLEWNNTSDAWTPRLIDVNGLIRGLQPAFAAVLCKRLEVRLELSARLDVALIDGTRLERTLLDLAASCSREVDAVDQFSIETKTRELDDKIVLAFGQGAAVPYSLIIVTVPDCGDAGVSLEGILEHWVSSDDMPKIGWRSGSSACAKLPHDAGYMLAEHSHGKCQFFLYVPPASLKGTQPRRSAEIPRQAGTVLVAEDEVSVRRLITHAMRNRGYAVLEAGNGTEALEMAHLHDATIDVLVTDMNMPGMTGRELAKTLRGRHPDLLTVFLSGSNIESLGVLDPREAAGFLAKPFDIAALVQIVATLLEGEAA